MPSIIKGDLIEMALNGEFDVIAHGCNCFCIMKDGIGKKMSEVFRCDSYSLEDKKHFGSFVKLANIQYNDFFVEEGRISPQGKRVKVYNLYTQYGPGMSMPPYNIPLDYDALRICIRKLLYTNKRARIGIPWIGCGMGKGDKEKVFRMIEEEEKVFSGQIFIVEV